MTDHRGSKQGLWDEEEDETRPTNPDLDRRPTNPTAARAADLQASDMKEEDLPTETEIESAIELVRMTMPPSGPSAAQAAERSDNASSGTMSPEAIESVARFISDPGVLAQNTNRDLDAPRRSLEAIELLDAPDAPEYGAEPTDMRAPPQPPPTPGRRAADEDLPSIVLGSQVSTRADQTERTRTIPLTHPMANSIAPGGSAVSTPPRARKSSRWQVALGVAALIAIGFGSRLLQSRGEHHAASGLPNEQEEEALSRRDEPSKSVEPTEQDRIARQLAEAEAARRAEAEATAAREAEDQRLAQESLAKQQADALAQAARQRAEKENAQAKKARSLRVGLGGVRMIEREQGAASEAAGPDRAKVVAAMNAIAPQLQSCVGAEHGVADVTLTVRAPGVVSHALVEGAFADSPQGSCIAKALRAAKLPPFDEPVTRIEYPISL